MLVRKPTSKKRTTAGTTTVDPLNSSLTSIEWLPNMQIGKNSLTSSTTPIEQQQQPTPRSSSESTLPLPLPATLPVSLSANIQHKLEATEMDTTAAGVGAAGNAYLKPPFSYVTLIRRAILSANTQRMTLNEIYQWIVDAYPYFRTAPPKWKNSIRHNLSLNKCFKRLQRSTNDPGKGSYWALDESCESGSPSTNRKRPIGEPQLPLHLLPPSPTGTTQQPSYFYTNNNPMFCDVNSSGGQSSSPDDSNSNMALTPNTNWLPLGDMNIELTASFRRFREQVLDNSSTTSVVVGGHFLCTKKVRQSRNSVQCSNPRILSDIPSSTSTVGTAAWGHELFPNGETNGFLESIKLASSGEINWNDIDVKPYCEFLDGFRTSSTFPQQDREKLINLASSLTSFFDYTGITNLAQSRAAHEMNRLPIISGGTTAGTTINHTSLPVVIEEDVGSFDWDSIT